MKAKKFLYQAAPGCEPAEGLCVEGAHHIIPGTFERCWECGVEPSAQHIKGCKGSDAGYELIETMIIVPCDGSCRQEEIELDDGTAAWVLLHSSSSPVR